MQRFDKKAQLIGVAFPQSAEQPAPDECSIIGFFRMTSYYGYKMLTSMGQSPVFIVIKI
jgi:hypothetical protein